MFRKYRKNKKPVVSSSERFYSELDTEKFENDIDKILEENWGSSNNIRIKIDTKYINQAKLELAIREEIAYKKRFRENFDAYEILDTVVSELLTISERDEIIEDMVDKICLELEKKGYTSDYNKKDIDYDFAWENVLEYIEDKVNNGYIQIVLSDDDYDKIENKIKEIIKEKSVVSSERKSTMKKNSKKSLDFIFASVEELVKQCYEHEENKDNVQSLISQKLGELKTVLSAEEITEPAETCKGKSWQNCEKKQHRKFMAKRHGRNMVRGIKENRDLYEETPDKYSDEEIEDLVSLSRWGDRKGFNERKFAEEYIGLRNARRYADNGYLDEYSI